MTTVPARLQYLDDHSTCMVSINQSRKHHSTCTTTVPGRPQYLHGIYKPVAQASQYLHDYSTGITYPRLHSPHVGFSNYTSRPSGVGAASPGTRHMGKRTTNGAEVTYLPGRNPKEGTPLLQPPVPAHTGAGGGLLLIQVTITCCY